MIAVTGGCACGAVRYRAEIDAAAGYWCHCRMCQRAGGGPAMAFVTPKRTALEWTRGRPVRWQSSPIAVRSHCGTCGTPLSFEYPDADNVDLTLGSLDDPGVVQLSEHVGCESRLEHWLPRDGRPESRSEESGALQARWARAKAGA